MTLRALTAGLVLSCSPVASSSDEVIALEVRSPVSQQIALGDTTQLEAVAITAGGEVAPEAQILWAILDVDSGNVAISLDTLTGTAVGIRIGSTRVQARVETLRSDALTIVVVDSAAPRGFRP